MVCKKQGSSTLGPLYEEKTSLTWQVFSPYYVADKLLPSKNNFALRPPIISRSVTFQMGFCEIIQL